MLSSSAVAVRCVSLSVSDGAVIRRRAAVAVIVSGTNSRDVLETRARFMSENDPIL